MRLLIISLVFLASLSTLGQDKPKAELVDEFGFIHCDEMLARIDNFSIQISRSPNSRGFVVISGSSEHLIEKLKLEIPLAYAIRRPGADVSSKITVIRSNETGRALMQFWVVPEGAEAPKPSASSWDLTIPNDTKPFYFFSDLDPICSYGAVFEALRELMDANPKLRVNAVVGARTAREFRSKVADIRTWLGKNNARRAKFFRKKKVDYYVPTTDFWIVP